AHVPHGWRRRRARATGGPRVSIRRRDESEWGRTRIVSRTGAGRRRGAIARNAGRGGRLAGRILLLPAPSLWRGGGVPPRVRLPQAGARPGAPRGARVRHRSAI